MPSKYWDWIQSFVLLPLWPLAMTIHAIVIFGALVVNLIRSARSRGLLLLVMAFGLQANVYGQSILNFGAAWCKPCHEMQPIEWQLVGEGVKFDAIDVDQQQQLAAQFKASRLPTFVAVDASGREVGRIVGKCSIGDLRGLWNKASRSTTSPTPKTENRNPVPASVPPLPVEVRASIVQVRAGNRMGTGTLLEGGLVITCHHVIVESVDCTIGFVGGVPIAGRVVAASEIDDLAVIELDGPSSARPIALATSEAAPGEPLAHGGFGQGQFAVMRGAAVQFVALNHSPSNNGIDVGGPSRKGDSGGPILNARFELCGVLCGADQASTCGACLGPIRRILQRVRGRRAPQGNPSGIAIAPVPPRPNVTTLPATLPDVQLEQLRSALSELTDERDQLRRQLDECQRHGQGLQEASSAADRERDELKQKLADHESLLKRALADKDSAIERLKAEAAGARSMVRDHQQTHVEQLSAKDKIIERLKADARIAIAEVATRIEPDIREVAKTGVTALLVSFGLPAGIAGLVAGGGVWLAMRRGKKKLNQQLAAIGVKTTSEGSLLLRRNRYVPYETNVVDKAWADAHAILVEKYPGWRKPLSEAQELKDQLLAGKPRQQIEES